MILAAPFVLGPVTFASSAMLAAAAATAAPILIHLALRQKYRRTPFPAIQFVLATHKAGRRANRLKYLLLLVLRMLIVLLVVGILAGPSINTTQRFLPTAAPADVVFCFDDSASMGYRVDGRSGLQRARDLAGDLLDDSDRFPTGSRFTVLRAAEPGAPAPLSPIRANVRAAMDRLEPAPTDPGLGAAIRAARRILAEGDRPRKEIILFTDMSPHAWRDVRQRSTTEAEANITCMDVGPEQYANMALEVPPPESRVLPTGKVLRFSVALRSFDSALPRRIELNIDSRTTARSASLDLPPQTRQTVDLEAGPLEPGVYHLQWQLTGTDNLEIDDRRYVTIEVGESVSVLIVGNESPAPPASEAHLIAAMIAPDVLTPSRSLYDVNRCTVETLPARDPSEPGVVIFADAAEPNPGTWDWVGRFLQNGGTLLVVPGDSLVRQRYAAGKAVLPALPGETLRLDEPARLRNLSVDHAYLAPFADPQISSLTQRDAARRLGVSEVNADSTVLADFGPKAPGILVRKVAAGTVVMLAFSPAPQWGNFGTQAGPLLVFLHTVLDVHAARSTKVGHVATNSTAAMRPEDLPPNARGWLHRIGDDAQTDSPRAMALRPDGRFALDTTAPGHYAVEFRGDDVAMSAGYSVNLPDAETNGHRADEKQLAALFEKEPFALLRDPAQWGLQAENRTIGRSIAGELAMGLLAALLAESLYANRFYRSQPTP